MPEAMVFQSTPLMRGETSVRTCVCRALIFQSTPLMRGETAQNGGTAAGRGISIHSPHARGDVDALTDMLRLQPDFNPLPSCEGRQHKPPKIHPDLRQLTQQNHDTPLFGALQAPFFAAQSPIFGVRSPRESHDSFTFARPRGARYHSMIWQVTPCGRCSVSTEN